MGVNGTGIPDIIITPDLLQQQLPTKDPSDPFGQVEQQFELRRGQLHRLALGLHLVTLDINKQWAYLQQRRGLRFR